MVHLSKFLCESEFMLNEGIFIVIAMIVLLILSAFFSASETAYSTANLIRIKNYADDKVKGARKALYICENYDKTLSTILVGNNLVNIANTTLGAFLFTNLITNPTLSNILNTIIMTIAVLIFGEILPKSMAKIKSEKYALKYAGIMYGVIVFLTPITFFFLKMQKRVAKKVEKGSADKMPTVTEDELESIIDTMEEEGVIDSDNANIFQGVLDLSVKTAYDILTPRVDIVALDISSSDSQIKDAFIDSTYSRLPLYSGDIDHIVAIVNQKDFFPAYLKDNNFDINKITTEPLYINENVKVDEIIKQMRKQKKHLAIVLDEYGGTSGLVSLEDALEEMVGEIYDEHDSEEDREMFVKTGENEYEVDADIELDKLFGLLGIENLPDSEYSTLGGFLFELSESVPEENKEVKFNTIDEIFDKVNGYIEKPVTIKFKLIKVEDRRIRKVKLFVDYGDFEVQKIDLSDD